MHKLETRYLFYGSKVNLGSFGVIGVKFWFSLKMHYLFYITKYIHVIHTLASHLRNKQGNWGQSGVDVLKPAGYAVCDGNMSSFIYLFLFLKNNMIILKQMSDKLKNGIKMLVGQVVLELLIKTCKILFWSIAREPLGLLKGGYCTHY